MQEGKLIAVQQLLIVGADIEERGAYQMTPLLYACFRGEAAVAKVLIENGADLCARDDGNWTAIHCMATCCGAKAATALLPIVKALVEGGVSPSLKCNHGRSAYDIARSHRSKEIAEYLWSKLSSDERVSATPPSR